MSGVRWRVCSDPAAVGRAAAELVGMDIAARAPAAGSYVLGCPGGRSGRTTYTALASVVARERLDLSGLVIAMMDEYLTTIPDGRQERIPEGLPHSCRRFAQEEILAPLSRAAGPGRGIGEENLWLPDPVDPQAYDRRLAEVGGIDLFLLACGAGDGHVGFNPPGSAADSRTRVIELADQTRRDNLVTFPTLASLDAVPRYGVSVGIGTIRDLSKTAVMLVHGPDKTVAARHLAAADRYDPAWPATVIASCAGGSVYVDEAAAADLPRSPTTDRGPPACERPAPVADTSPTRPKRS